MAKLQEEVLVVKISRLLKDNEQESVIIDAASLVSLEAVVQELAGAGALVEIQTA
jgi:hypothetical protein